MERKRKMRMLYEAAEEGNTTSLLSLLQEDEHILDKFSFKETPLHMAAMLGHLNFVKEILIRRPELVGVLDFGRRSPLHLATANGHLDVVKELLVVDPEMCFAQDRDGQNAIHIAITRGQIEVLKELARAKPEAALVLTNQDETALHLCVKCNQLEALQFLFGMIDDPEFLNLKDGDGFTVLHRAVAERQIEIINFLITNTATDINAQNADGLTALDLALPHTQNTEYSGDTYIKDLLLRAGAVTTTDALPPGLDVQPMSAVDNTTNWLEANQNAVMGVAAVLAATAFHGRNNAPAGFSLITYGMFLTFNETGFLASLLVILLLLSGLPLKSKFFEQFLSVTLLVAVLSTAAAYIILVSSFSSIFREAS